MQNQGNVDFSTLIRIHRIFYNEVSFTLRRYIYTDFETDLGEVWGKFANDFASKLPGELSEFDRRLANMTGRIRQYDRLKDWNALDAVERVLGDFDVLSAGREIKDRTALVAITFWRPVIERVGKKVLPFMGIQRYLRKEDYKSNLIRLFEELLGDQEVRQQVGKLARSTFQAILGQLPAQSGPTHSPYTSTSR